MAKFLVQYDTLATTATTTKSCVKSKQNAKLEGRDLVAVAVAVQRNANAFIDFFFF